MWTEQHRAEVKGDLRELWSTPISARQLDEFCTGLESSGVYADTVRQVLREIWRTQTRTSRPTFRQITKACSAVIHEYREKKQRNKENREPGVDEISWEEFKAGIVNDECRPDDEKAYSYLCDLIDRGVVRAGLVGVVDEPIDVRLYRGYLNYFGEEKALGLLREQKQWSEERIKRAQEWTA